jgi:hypothetical protein
MLFQILWAARNGVRFEIGRRANHRQTHLFGYADGDHVALDELTELNASVVLPNHEIDRSLEEVTSSTISG